MRSLAVLTLLCSLLVVATSLPDYFDNLHFNNYYPTTFQQGILPYNQGFNLGYLPYGTGYGVGYGMGYGMPHYFGGFNPMYYYQRPFATNSYWK